MQDGFRAIESGNSKPPPKAPPVQDATLVQFSQPEQLPRSSVIRLRVLTGVAQGREIRVDSPQILTFGRDLDTSIPLEGDPFFSRQHFRLEVIPPRCRLLDLGSTNGTIVNGIVVRGPIELRDGDRFGGGDTLVEMSVISEAAEEIATLQWPGFVTRSSSAEEAGDIRPGDSIASYEVISTLGRGGMGIVYHGRHKATGKSVAIKMLHAQRSADSARLRLFVREASLMLQLKHPKIVEASDFGLHDNTPYLVMEYLSTMDLMAFIARQSRRKAIRTACWVAVEVLEALAYAHQQNMVHRDVKPSNILAFQRNGRLHAKLADFGLAKRFQEAGFSTLTTEGEVRGTVIYMAPEQLLDSKFAKPSSDLYSLAASLYYLLCRQHYVDLTPGASVFKAMLEGNRIPLRDRAVDIPIGLAEIVDRSLSLNLDERFATAEELGSALEPYSKKTNA